MCSSFKNCIHFLKNKNHGKFGKNVQENPVNFFEIVTIIVSKPYFGVRVRQIKNVYIFRFSIIPVSSFWPCYKKLPE